MSKYVIELGKDVQIVQSIIVTQNGNAYTHTEWVKNLEELNSDYINEHFGELQDKAYQRGLDDAWEAAKKMFSSMSDSDIEKVFPIEWNNGGFNALMNLQPHEAIAKLKAYEEQKADELKAGEIVDWNGEKYIVSYIYDDGRADLIYLECGSVCESVSPDCFTRTGKHYDITKILEEIKE